MKFFSLVISLVALFFAVAPNTIPEREIEEVCWDSQASFIYLRSPTNGSSAMDNRTYQPVIFDETTASGDAVITNGTNPNTQHIELGRGTWELSSVLRGARIDPITGGHDLTDDLLGVAYKWVCSTDDGVTWSDVVESTVAGTTSASSLSRNPTGRDHVAAGIVQGPIWVRLEAFFASIDSSGSGTGVHYTNFADAITTNGFSSSWARINKVEHWGTKTNQSASFRQDPAQNGTTFSTLEAIDLKTGDVNSPDFDAYDINTAKNIEFLCNGYYLVSYNFCFVSDTADTRVRLSVHRDGVQANGWTAVSGATLGNTNEETTTSASFIINADINEVMSFKAEAIDASGGNPTTEFGCGNVAIVFLGSREVSQ